MKIKVVNQRIKIEPPETAEGTREYLRAEFDFSWEWDGLTKTAFFRGANGNTYSQLLENDACTVPAEALAVPGRVGVSVSGTRGETIITTDIKSFSVPATLSGGTPSDPEPTLWQEVLDKFEKVSEVEEKVTELKSEIATKITAPENPEVGKAFKIKSVNDDGTFIGEWADCTNLDVRINGESIVQNGVAEIPIANRDNVFGVVKTIPYEFCGTGVGADRDGNLRLYPASNGNIDARQKINVSPISVNNLDYAVKAAMCDGKGAAWTAEEQAAARERMGIDEWEDVLDVTLEKDSLFSADFEHEYKQLYIYIDQSGVTEKIYAVIYLCPYSYVNSEGKKISTFGSYYPSTSNAFSNVASVWKSYGKVTTRIASVTNDQKNTTGNLTACLKVWDTSMSKINGIGNPFKGIYPSSTIFKAGTRIVVKGVRA